MNDHEAHDPVGTHAEPMAAARQRRPTMAKDRILRIARGL